MSDITDDLLDSLRHHESGGNDRAVSPKGAMGPYQLMPATARELGVKNSFDEPQAREGAKRYLTRLVDKYEGDVEKALVAYNWGPGNVDKTGVEKAPEESKQYAKKVLARANQGKKADAKPADAAPDPKAEDEGFTLAGLMAKYGGGKKQPAAAPTAAPAAAPTTPAAEADPTLAALKAKYGAQATPAAKAPTLKQQLMPQVKEGGEQLSQELEGVKQSLGDIYYGGKQLATRGAEAIGLAPKGSSIKADEEVRQREIEYQKRTPKGSGLGRVLGAVGPALLTGGDTLAANVLSGVGQAAVQPVTDTSEESFASQKAKQIGLGAAIPLGAKSAVEGFKYAMRGGEEAAGKMAENIAEYRRAGVESPTLGQVSEGGTTKGSGAFAGTLEEQRGQLATRFEDVADRISTAKTPEDAGKVLFEGIRGTKNAQGAYEGGWMGKFKEGQEKLYAKVDRYLPPDTAAKLDNTLAALRDVATPRAGAPATSAQFIDRNLQQAYYSLLDDAGKARKLPYEEIKALRSRLGEMIDKSVIDPSIKIGDVKAVYAALSRDMEAAAAARGPRAVKALKDANAFTAAGHDLMETHLQPILNSKLKSQMLDEATRGTADSGERIKAVLGTLDPVQADAIKGVVLRELGRKGQAGFDAGQLFTNWNKMHPDAVTALFGKEGSNLRTSIDRMASVAANVEKEGVTLNDLRNYATGHGAEGGLAALAYLTHRSGLAAVLMGGAGAGFLTGRMVQNPTFMKWLAQTSTRVPSQLPSALSALATKAKDLAPDDREEVNAYIANVQSLLPNGTVVQRRADKTLLPQRMPAPATAPTPAKPMQTSAADGEDAYSNEEYAPTAPPSKLQRKMALQRQEATA